MQLGCPAAVVGGTPRGRSSASGHPLADLEPLEGVLRQVAVRREDADALVGLVSQDRQGASSCGAVLWARVWTTPWGGARRGVPGLTNGRCRGLPCAARRWGAFRHRRAPRGRSPGLIVAPDAHRTPPSSSPRRSSQSARRSRPPSVRAEEEAAHSQSSSSARCAGRRPVPDRRGALGPGLEPRPTAEPWETGGRPQGPGSCSRPASGGSFAASSAPQAGASLIVTYRSWLQPHNPSRVRHAPRGSRPRRREQERDLLLLERAARWYPAATPAAARVDHSFA